MTDPKTTIRSLGRSWLVLAVLGAATGCPGLDHRGLVIDDGSPAQAGTPHGEGGPPPGDSAAPSPLPADGGVRGGEDLAPPATDLVLRPEMSGGPRDARPAATVDASAPADGDAASESRDAMAADRTAPDAAPSLSVGLVAHWRLDEGGGTTTADSSGNGNTGTLLNGTSWISGGVIGARFPNPGALSFDGIDDRVELRPRALPTLGSAKSISLWFLDNSGGTGGSRLRDLIALASPGERAAIQVGFEHGFPAVWTWGPRSMIRSGFSTPPGWHHLAYTFDGSVHRLYIDATLVGNATRSVPDVAITHAILGDFGPSRFTEQFNGRLDDVRIYGRVLATEEIASLAAGE